MPTGTPLTRSEIATLQNRARLHSAARVRVALLEQENKDLKRQLEAKERDIETLKQKLEATEKKMREQEDANKKLAAMLFGHVPPHRTKRTHVAVVRTKASYRRKKPGEVTERKTLSLADCPDCGNEVSGVQSSRTRVIEDIIFHPKPSVTEWTITRHYCANCNKLVEGTVPGVLPHAVIGPNTMTYVLLAKYRWNLPYEKIKDNLAISFGLALSEGEIASLLEKASGLVGTKWDAIVAAVKAGTVVHCDETGWYIDGKKVWAHAFTTTEAVLYDILPTRGKGVAVERLGKDFQGTRVSDCLLNYKNLAGKHQICWAHLTREAGENCDRDPTGGERKQLNKILNIIYQDLRAATGTWEKDEAVRVKAKCEARVATLLKKTWDDPASARLVNRLDDFHSALFTCLEYPGIPPDNNHAERVLRKLVVQRKISGGNRSPAHASIHAKLMSVIETLRLEGGDLLANLQALLRHGIAARLSGE